VVADKQVIADALLRFKEVVASHSADEQKELVQLVIKEIFVKHLDSETDEAAKENGVFKTKIRTKWYLVNISLFASDLIPEGCKFGGESSD
jgi:hypothetical protein